MFALKGQFTSTQGNALRLDNGNAMFALKGQFTSTQGNALKLDNGNSMSP